MYLCIATLVSMSKSMSVEYFSEFSTVSSKNSFISISIPYQTLYASLNSSKFNIPSNIQHIYYNIYSFLALASSYCPDTIRVLKCPSTYYNYLRVFRQKIIY